MKKKPTMKERLAWIEKLKNAPFKEHGSDGQTHCRWQECCYGPAGSRAGAIKVKRGRGGK